MRITVIGAGYVGLTTALLFAQTNKKVILVESDIKKLELLKNGETYFFEPGLESLLVRSIKNNNIEFKQRYDDVSIKQDIVFSCVGTPDNPDGSLDLSFVFEVANSVADHKHDNFLFVQKSTVPVGTGEKIKKKFSDKAKEITYLSNPEFLREGTAVLDSLGPDRVVVGSDLNSKNQSKQLMEVYAKLLNRRRKILGLSGIDDVSRKVNSNFIQTTIPSAELIKVTSNAFLALKISFSNSIAKLSDKVNADVNEILYAVGSDNRIGTAFLNAGRGYGGGCFPKDLSGLVASATEYGVDLSILKEVIRTNNSMVGYIAEKIKHKFNDNLIDKRIAILGVSFKQGTSDSRKSPAIALTNILIKHGATVKVYDPKAIKTRPTDMSSEAKLCDSATNCVKSAHIVCIMTDWDEFRKLDYESLLSTMDSNVFLDGVNSYDRAKLSSYGYIYMGVGR